MYIKMNEIAQNENYFEDAVVEYKKKQWQVAKAFLVGCMELWAILNKHREVMKVQNKWLEYCEKIGIHITQANDQIRLYLYAKEHNKAEVMKKIVTNWAKLKLFLSLPWEMKELTLQDEELDETTSTADFRDKVGKLNKDTIEELAIEEEVPWYSPEEGKIEHLLQNIPATAKAIQSENKLDKKARSHVEGILYMQKASLLLSDPYVIKDEDRVFVKEHLEDQIQKMQSILSLYQ